MGSPEGEPGRDSDERPHRVCIERDYALGRTEVMVGEFKRFVEATSYRTDAEKNAGGSEGCYVAYREGNEWKYGYRVGYSWRNPNFRQGDDHSVACVSWNDAVAYAGWLSRETGKEYRLPTEAEWEYAARAGTPTARYWGDDSNQACRYANVADQTAKQTFTGWTIHECSDDYVYTAPVGTFEANRWGLKDMLGNVWEWTCSEWDSGYGGEETRCSKNDTVGARALRGGSWSNDPGGVRSAFRHWGGPTARLLQPRLPSRPILISLCSLSFYPLRARSARFFRAFF
jgi:serine/threonine-protein kinase PpkA